MSGPTATPPQPVLVRMHLADNVAIVGNEGGLPAGTVLPEPAAGRALRERVPQAHKVALVDIPDFSGPMRRIAGSAEKMANLPPGGGDTLEAPTDHTPAPPALPSPSAHDVAAPRRNA